MYENDRCDHVYKCYLNAIYIINNDLDYYLQKKEILKSLPI